MAAGGDERDIDLGSYRSFDDIGASDTAKIYQDLTQSSPRGRARQPKRIIHFVDGSTMEEYATEDEDDETASAAAAAAAAPVDVTKLSWPQWFWHYTVASATKSLAAADFCGEKLAWFFGITTPKYQYVIDEYNRMKEEEERQERLEQEARANELCEQTTVIEQMEGGVAIEPEESAPAPAAAAAAAAVAAAV